MVGSISRSVEVIDGHIHIWGGPVGQGLLLERMQAAGVGGGILISSAPSSFGKWHAHAPEQRLDNLLAWTQGSADLYPFYWIDPLEPDAAEQVGLAHRAGALGYKVICNHFYPREPRALEVFHAIAETGKPILFHSGILWDGEDSSRYSRPAEFEALLGVEGIRFSLAHISWPWCDECIALYGKLQHSRLSMKMYVDLTPGTPPIYREEALTKLFTVGYKVEDNVFFGSDCSAEDYNAGRVRAMIERDNAIYGKLDLTGETMGKIWAGNVTRFVSG